MSRVQLFIIFIGFNLLSSCNFFHTESEYQDLLKSYKKTGGEISRMSESKFSMEERI